MIRDIALWASGMLDPHMGGEGVKPYQPAGLWSALMHPASNTKNYVQDKGQRLYRRSLYTFWKDRLRAGPTSFSAKRTGMVVLVSQGSWSGSLTDLQATSLLL